MASCNLCHHPQRGGNTGKVCIIRFPSAKWHTFTFICCLTGWAQENAPQTPGLTRLWQFLKECKLLSYWRKVPEKFTCVADLSCPESLLVASSRLMKFCCSEVEQTVFLKSVLLDAQILVSLSHDLGPKRSSLIEEAGVASPYYVKSKWLLSPSWGRQVKCLGLFYSPRPHPAAPQHTHAVWAPLRTGKGTVSHLSLQIREIEHRPPRQQVHLRSGWKGSESSHIPYHVAISHLQSPRVFDVVA